MIRGMSGDKDEMEEEELEDDEEVEERCASEAPTQQPSEIAAGAAAAAAEAPGACPSNGQIPGSDRWAAAAAEEIGCPAERKGEGTR